MGVRGFLLITLLALGAAASAAQAATIPVTTTADVTAEDGLCSLREAILAARVNLPVQGCPAGSVDGVDTVQLSAATYTLAQPGPGEDGNMTGDLDTGPGHAMRITGRGAGTTVIDANGLDRAFDVFATATLTLEDLAVRGGVAPGGKVTDNPEAGGDGGAVHNLGSLSVARVAFEDNVAGAGDGGSFGEDGGTGGGGGAIWSGSGAGDPCPDRWIAA